MPAAVRRVALAGAIALGWGFIAWHNHFYLTPAVVILALGWGAVVSTVYLLWRLGAAGADPAVVGEDWWLATGAQEDLMREKRALLKTIREIEFDHQIGKLSDEDAEEMMQVVRVETIEVMKAIDQAAELESSGGVRAEIERELRARIESRGRAQGSAQGQR
ncbi:MAG: hypothetical protein HC863_01770 [Myxococcales bacterium]|nr:hypothetical protein [Myxococcales bacterium]